MNTITFPKTEKLLYFRSMLSHPMMISFNRLKEESLKNNNIENLITDYYDIKSYLLNMALHISEQGAYAPSPWQHFILSEILLNENALTLLMEKSIIDEKNPMLPGFLNDMAILSELFSFDWTRFLKEIPIDEDIIITQAIFEPSDTRKVLSETFSSGELIEILLSLNHYIQQTGLGIFEQSSRFKIDDDHRIIPIVNKTMPTMNQLIGYQTQKKALIENTTAFVQKNLGLNVLLQGDMGTGKSTMVKALVHAFSEQNLKMIEIKRNQLTALQKIISQLSCRPYHFIIFIDDLSFDENDENFMLFKNCLEGSLEDNLENIRIYATSNKRHLITETQSERNDAVHARDIIQEKLSLSARFGLIINFSAPDQKEYLAIVNELAKASNLEIDQTQLEALALQWEIRHLNRSGRTAEQLIKTLLF